MKKINIVKSNDDFNNIIKNGKILKNKYYVIYYIDQIKDKYKIGISVPKKIGKAVIRNKIKRQIKSILDNNTEKIQKIDYIIITRSLILNLNYNEKEKELINLLNNL